MPTGLLVDHTNHVTTLTLDGGVAGNLVGMATIAALSNALRAVPAECKLVVLQAQGPDFCKGRDYSEAPEDADRTGRPTAVQIRERMTRPIVELYGLLRGLDVPSVSVVRGTARGFGCALACSSDIVLCGDSARFSLPEMVERGLPPSLAMTALWQRIPQRALVHMVFSGREVAGATAVQLGIASACFADDRLDAEVAALASTVSKQPLASVRAVKEYLKRAPDATDLGRASLGESLYAMVAASHG